MESQETSQSFEPPLEKAAGFIFKQTPAKERKALRAQLLRKFPQKVPCIIEKYYRCEKAL